MGEDLAYCCPLTSTGDKHAGRVGMGNHAGVDQRLVIGEFVHLCRLGLAVENQRAAKSRAVHHLDVLEVGLPPKENLQPLFDLKKSWGDEFVVPVTKGRAFNHDAAPEGAIWASCPRCISVIEG